MLYSDQVYSEHSAVYTSHSQQALAVLGPDFLTDLVPAAMIRGELMLYIDH